MIDKLNKCIIITMPWNELETYLNDRLKGTSPLVSHEQTIIDAHEFYTLYKELIGTKISSIHVSNLYMQLATGKYYSAIDMDKQGPIQMYVAQNIMHVGAAYYIV